MKRNDKKGFTIIELVVVIAVIAILAAVLIPTFSSIIKKAKISNDTQLVKNLNTALAADTDSHKTMTDALAAAAEFGYDVAKINASATDNEILWDSANDLFCYLNDGTIEYIPEFSPSTKPADYQYWAIYAEFPTAQTYSVYWNSENALPDDTVLTVGFDTGKYATNLDLTYKGSTSAQVVVIRTNGGTLTIDADKDTVHHYGNASTVNVTAVAPDSYHAYGTVGVITVKKGHVVVESSATVSMVTKSTDSTEGTDTVTVTNNGNITIAPDVNVTGTQPTQPAGTTQSTLTNAGGYFKLSNDQTISTSLTLDKDTILDLNGHTLTFSNCALDITANVTVVDTSSGQNGKLTRTNYETNDRWFIVIKEGGQLVLNSGEIEGITQGIYDSKYYAMIKVERESTLVVNGGSIISTGASNFNGAAVVTPILVAGQDAKCYINGGLIECKKGNFALCGNGSNSDGTYIEINGGTLKSDDVTVYHPQVGILNINGGYIEGGTAVYQKAGTMNITGGTFKATKEYTSYTYNGSGANPTGDAIVIDSCKGYGNGATVANINLSSTKISVNGSGASKVKGYIYGTDTKPVIIWNGEQVKAINV